MSIIIQSSQVVSEGDGVRLKRLMPLAGLRNFDPFVLWDHFDIGSGGFPDHPHRGFEGITYLFAGGMQHTDNLGNRGTIKAGGAQCFTAGRGIVHSEFPDGHAAGIQLWVNLAAADKQLDAEYQQVGVEDLPVRQDGSSTITTIIGEGSPIRLHSKVCYQEIQLHDEYCCAIADGWRGFIYVVQGLLRINGVDCMESQAAFIEFEHNVKLESSAGARIMLCIGKAHGGKIHQHGPFVD